MCSRPPPALFIATLPPPTPSRLLNRFPWSQKVSFFIFLFVVIVARAELLQAFWSRSMIVVAGCRTCLVVRFPPSCRIAEYDPFFGGNALNQFCRAKAPIQRFSRFQREGDDRFAAGIRDGRYFHPALCVWCLFPFFLLYHSWPNVFVSRGYYFVSLFWLFFSFCFCYFDPFVYDLIRFFVAALVCFDWVFQNMIFGLICVLFLFSIDVVYIDIANEDNSVLFLYLIYFVYNLTPLGFLFFVYSPFFRFVYIFSRRFVFVLCYVYTVCFILNYFSFCLVLFTFFSWRLFLFTFRFLFSLFVLFSILFLFVLLLFSLFLSNLVYMFASWFVSLL